MNLRIKRIYAKLESTNLDALLLSSLFNITYLTDYRSRDAYLLVSKKGNFYITDSRYTEEAKRNLDKSFVITKINGSLIKIIADICADIKLKALGFEEKYMSCFDYLKLKEGLNKQINLIPTHELVEELREIKTPQELEKIRKAIKITKKAFAFMKNAIAPGRKELEIAAELERFIRHNGAYSSAFDTIVGSGTNSSFPHHLTSQRRIKNNEPVLVDMGVDYLGYKSDLTRVFFLGKITSIIRRVYDIVRKAHDRAIQEIKPGVFINKIDQVARQYITENGYGGFFAHALGHGVGLETHEDPRISSKTKKALRSGMVFTIEPAVYLPNKFGIRIEDMVLVTQKGCEVLSGSIN